MLYLSGKSSLCDHEWICIGLYHYPEEYHWRGETVELPVAVDAPETIVISIVSRRRGNLGPWILVFKVVSLALDMPLDGDVGGSIGVLVSMAASARMQFFVVAGEGAIDMSMVPRRCGILGP